MYNKKAQAQIITVILLILLVLASIVIVWQVINQTVKGGGEQISEQSKCMGLDITVTNSTPLIFNVRRTATGGTFESADVAVVVDKIRLDKDVGYALSSNTLKDTLGTGTITFTAGNEPSTDIEIALIGDGVTCPSTAKLEF